MDLETQTEQGGSGRRAARLHGCGQRGWSLHLSRAVARHHRSARYGLPEWRTAGGHPWSNTDYSDARRMCKVTSVQGGPILLAQWWDTSGTTICCKRSRTPAEVQRLFTWMSTDSPRRLVIAVAAVGVLASAAAPASAEPPAPATCFSYSADQWLQSTFTADPGDCATPQRRGAGNREPAAGGRRGWHASAGVKRWAFQACQPIAVDYVWTKPKPKFPRPHTSCRAAPASMCSSRPWTHGTLVSGGSRAWDRAATPASAPRSPVLDLLRGRPEAVRVPQPAELARDEMQRPTPCG